MLPTTTTTTVTVNLSHSLTYEQNKSHHALRICPFVVVETNKFAKRRVQHNACIRIKDTRTRISSDLKKTFSNDCNNQ